MFRIVFIIIATIIIFLQLLLLPSISQSLLSLWELIKENKEWVFSGIGVATITSLLAFGRWLFQKKIIESKGENSHLLGHWNCTWNIDFPANYVKPFTDTIVITKVKRNFIEGYGENPDIGKYIVKGEIRRYSWILNYWGVERKEDLVGVILLKKEPLRSQLTGEWIQLIKTGQIARGTTTWEKAQRN